MKKKTLCVLLLVVIVVACGILVSKKVVEQKDAQPVNFQSERMHYFACRDINEWELTKNGGEPYEVTVGQCNSVTLLFLDCITLFEPEELNDLLLFPNLKELNLFHKPEDTLEYQSELEERSEALQEKFAEVLPELKELQELCITDDCDLVLHDLDFLSDCENLHTLIVDHNTIQDISALAELDKLTRLILDCNEITDISPILGLENLEMITIYENPVCDDEEQMELLRKTFPNATIYTRYEDWKRDMS